MILKGQFSKNLIEKQKEHKFIINMTDFRKEISELKDKRMNKKIEGMFELLSIDPNELTEEDAYFWNKLNKTPDSITQIDLDKYKKNVKDLKNISREYFSALIIQKITIIWLNKENQERRKQK